MRQLIEDKNGVVPDGQKRHSGHMSRDAYKNSTDA